MKKLKIAITLFLVLSFAVSLFAVLPNAKGAVIAVPDRATGAYISTNPDVIGVNQELTVNLWVYPSPNGPNYEIGRTLTGFGGLEGIRYNGLTITFTRPDGSKDAFTPMHGSAHSIGITAGQTDEVGGLWFLYKPTQTGTWSVSFNYPGETFTNINLISGNYSVYLKPSTSRTITFVVQDDPVQVTLPVQLPTDYWHRPINAENREWYQISGDWLGAASYGPSGSSDQPGNIYGAFNPYTTAPGSAHIVWSAEAALGGLIGGDWGSQSHNYGLDNPSGGITGGGPPIIWNGRVFTNDFGMAGSGRRDVLDSTWGPGEAKVITCRDLRTGKVVWQQPGSVTIGVQVTASLSATIGTALTQHAGTVIPYLWWYNSSGWYQYNAWTGYPDLFIPSTNASNSGIGAPSWVGNTLAFCLRQGTWNATSLRRPYNELICWNASKYTGGDWNNGVQWRTNLKQPDGTGPGEGSRGSAVKVFRNLDIVSVATIGEGRWYGFDLNTGKQLWMQDTGFLSMQYFWSPDDDMMMSYDSSDLTMHAWSVSRSSPWTKLWSAQIGVYPWDSQMGNPSIAWAYGNLYLGSFSGTEFCIDPKTGATKWTYFIGNGTETPYGSWAIYGASLVADGKLYFSTSEHSPSQPRTRGNRLTCIDANTGEFIWNMTSPIVPRACADGYIIGVSEYTGLMYAFGKGKTATSVTASPKASVIGSKILVEGSVLDMSPGSAGTAAISDEDMTDWMDYLYMQKPIPMNAKGVDVSLDAIDPNNNFVHIGTATSDQSGAYGLAFNPEVPGLYKIIATFAGSESYWASYAETFVNVEEAHAASAPEESVSVPDYTMIIVGVGVAIIIAVIVAVAIAVLILKKKP